VVVDYLQLVPTPVGVARVTQEEDMALVLRRLKALALDRQVAVSSRRRSALRPKRPIPAHARRLRRAGLREQHADIVLSVFARK